VPKRPGQGHQEAKASRPDVELPGRRPTGFFVVLAEFRNERHPNYPTRTRRRASPPATFEGPLNNQIPAPTVVDNSTVWQPNYDQQHYQDLYFGNATR